MMDAQSIQYIITAVVALAAFLCGARALHKLFQGDAISDTFTDAHHEVYMLIIFGFSLVALGEIAWVLIFQQSGNDVMYAAMPDFYWVVGYSIVFLGIWYAAYRVTQDRKGAKYGPAVLILPWIAGAVMFFMLPLLGIGVGDDQVAFFLRLYPTLSFMSLLVSAVVYYFAEDEYYVLLRPLLFIMVAMLIGDILFAIKGEEYDIISVVADLSYIISYSMVAYMFFQKHAAIGPSSKK